MAYTINFDRDFVAAEELQLIKTKEAILEKLRARFGEVSDTQTLKTANNLPTKKSSTKHGPQPR